MDFLFRRSYRGMVKAAIFDWAGTTVDYGCMAPAAVFINLFKNRGITLTPEQAREPMGLHKRDHIRTIAHMTGVARDWEAAHGHTPTEDDVENMFQEFVPALIETVRNHSDVIPGVLETMGELRNRAVKIGSTTGYSTEIMKSVRAEAERHGYTPENVVCADEVQVARPAPWMALLSAMQLNAFPPEAVVKVGDTPADIGEGLNAGMWTVGVVRHGNEVGLSQEQWQALSVDSRDAHAARAQQRLATAGAHFVVDTIADLPPVLDAINERLAAGERP